MKYMSTTSTDCKLKFLNHFSGNIGGGFPEEQTWLLNHLSSLIHLNGNFQPE